GLTGKVEREVLGVDYALDEAKPLGDEVRAVIGDEDATDVKLDVVLGALRLEEVEGGTFGDEEDGAELKLTFNGEVLDGKVVLPVTIRMLVSQLQPSVRYFLEKGI